MRDRDIIRRYWPGSSISQLTRLVANAEGISKQKARERVEWLVMQEVGRVARDERDGLAE